MKAINILNFSASTIIIIVVVLFMCFNGFSFTLSIVVALMALCAVVELFAIIADHTNKITVSSYPIGYRVIVTGHYDETTLVLQWGERFQRVNVNDVKRY